MHIGSYSPQHHIQLRWSITSLQSQMAAPRWYHRLRLTCDYMDQRGASRKEWYGQLHSNCVASLGHNKHCQGGHMKAYLHAQRQITSWWPFSVLLPGHQIYPDSFYIRLTRGWKVTIGIRVHFKYILSDYPRSDSADQLTIWFPSAQRKSVCWFDLAQRALKY